MTSESHQGGRARTPLLQVWDFVVKYGPAIAVIIYGVWTAGVWYVGRQDEAAKASEIALRESQKPFLEKQLAFYFEVAKVGGKLATLPPILAEYPKDQRFAEDWGWARRRFWELYWGELSVVESPEVARAMFGFGTALRDIERCVDARESDCPAKQVNLHGPSLDLAHKIRESIEKGWGYQLNPLPPAGEPAQ
jgi:hypothetical protein